MKIAFAAMLAIATLCALQVQSDEPAPQAKDAAVAAAPASEEQLVHTLEEAYELTIEQVKGGGTDMSAVIRLNERLYRAEVSSVDASKRMAAAKEHVSRAKKIEEIAALQLKHGVGTKVEHREAKASRLAAELEGAKLGG